MQKADVMFQERTKGYFDLLIRGKARETEVPLDQFTDALRRARYGISYPFEIHFLDGPPSRSHYKHRGRVPAGMKT